MKKLILAAALVLTGAVCLYGEILDWTALTRNAEFTAGGFNRTLMLGNKAYVIGGTNAASANVNEVYSSYNGVEWTCLTRNAEFGARSYFASVIFDSKMWVIGGTNADGRLNDAWYSTNGIEWTAATRNAEWSARAYHNAVTTTSAIILTGGTEPAENGVTFLNDVWSSTDGVEWTALTRNAEWTARDVHASVFYDDKIWVMGGENTSSGDLGTFDDAWYSTDGVEWTAATRNAAFQKKGYCSSVVFDGKMWMIAGFSRTSPTNPKDVCYSTDGVDWTIDTQNADFGSKISYGLFTSGIKMFLIGGGVERSVWSARLGISQDATHTPTITPTSYITHTWTSTKSCTPTRTPSLTRTRTVTPTFTATPTFTTTPTFTITSTFTATQTNTEVPTKTVTKTITETRTVTQTATETFTITETWTITETHTETPTFTVTLTPTPIETLMIDYASIDTDWHKSDIRIYMRQYPDAVDNPVLYSIYIQDILDPLSWPRIIQISNADDIDPSAESLSYDIQGQNVMGCHSITVTAKGGDLGVEYMSNNIVVCPQATPTPRRP